MSDVRSIPEEVMADKAAGLVRTTKRRATILRGWGWKVTEITYRYGPKGTGSARSYIMAERGIHGVTLEYLYRLNARYGSPVKFVGGFWDGGPIRSGKELDQLASPLKTTYNQSAGSTTKRGVMPTATTTTRKRAATKKAAATTNGAPARKRAAKKVVEEEFIEEDEAQPAKKGRPRKEGPTAAEIKSNEVAERRAERAAARDEDAETVYQMKEEGTSWDDIAEAMGKSVGLCQKLLYWHEARLLDGGDIPEPTVEDIVNDRDAGMSYPQIEVKYDITRGKVWSYLEEAGIDHFESDIGKGGRYVRRDPEVVEARRKEAAAKRATNPDGTPRTRRNRKAKFTGFTDETPDKDVMNAVEGKKIEWNKVRGEGTDSATVKEGTMEITEDKRGKRGLKFSDGRKTRTVYVNNIVAVG
jgi:hypothetical protein